MWMEIFLFLQKFRKAGVSAFWGQGRVYCSQWESNFRHFSPNIMLLDGLAKKLAVTLQFLELSVIEYRAR
jgi:hypothetical protein